MDNIIASAEITVTDVKDGVGISSVVTHFLATPLKKGITTATSGWDTEPQTMDDTNKYLWSYETIIYTDGYSQDSTPVIIGVYGEEGVGISDIVEYYLVSSKDKGIEVTDSQFDVKIPIMDETNRYLWKYEEIIYTNNERKKTQPVIVGVFGSKGTSVKNIENYYLTTSASSGVTRNTDGFNTSMQPLTLTNKYLWNYEVIEYENPTSFSYTNPVIIGVHGEDGKDGVDAKLLYLTSTLETMTFDADGAATPSSQTSTIEAKLQNTSGSVSFTAKAYSGTSALSNSVPLGGSGNSRTFSVSSFPSNATHVSITATLGNLTDTVSIFKLRHGKEGAGGAPGQNAIVGYLTNESITLGASSSGRVGSFTPATGTFRMFDGTTEVTTSASTTYTLENSNGLVASINSSGVYSITAMSSDTATAEFKATYKDVSIFKTVTLSKSIAGEKGDPGSNAPTISLSGDSQMIKQDALGNITPSTSFNITGVAVNTTITKWLFSVNGGAFGTGLTTGVTRSGNVVTVNPKTVTFNTLSIRAEDGTVADTFTIGRAVDGTKGDKGDKGDEGLDGIDAITVVLTNESHTFAGDTTSAIAGSVSTEFLAFKGANRTSVTIGNITGMPEGMTRTINTNNSQNAKVTFNVTTAMKSRSGIVTVQLTVDGKTINKTFSYSLSLKGEKGDTGDTGTGVKSAVVSYRNHTSGTATPPSTGWNENPPTPIKGQYMWTRTITTYTDNSNITTYSVAYNALDGGDGKGITSTTVTYAISTSGSATPTSWLSTRPTPDQGDYMWTRTVIKYTDGTESTAYNTSYSATDGQKGDPGEPGADGISITTIVEYYLISDKNSGITRTTSGWDTIIPTMSPTQRFLWNYEEIKFSDGTSKPTLPVIIGVYGQQGETGAEGRAVLGIQENYLISSSSSGITRSSSGWGTGVKNPTPTEKYLWNYETITWSKAPLTTYTEPVVIGVHGDKGDKGDSAPLVKLSGATQIITQSNTGVRTPSASFTVVGTSVNTTISAWTYSVNGGTFGTGLPTGVTRSGNTVTVAPGSITFNTLSIKATGGGVSDTFTIARIIDGDKGDKGDEGANGADAITVLLSNESHTFQAGTTNAVAGSTTTDIHAYKGTNKIPVTVGTITGMPTGMTRTISNNNTDNAKITFTVATNMTSPSGTVTINLTVDNKPIVKEFSYALTFKGGKGDKGDKGDTGDAGKDAISAVLTNESITFAADKDGVVQNYVGNTGNFLLMEGTTNQSAGTDFEKVSQTNVSATINSNGSYSIYPMTNGTSVTTGQVTFRATYKETVIDKTVTISKSIAGQTGGKGDPGAPGEKGDPGAPATSYWLTSSVDTITVKYNGDYDPKTITYYGHSKTGSNNTQNYAGRFIVQTSIDGVNFTEAYRSPVNMDKVDFSVPEDILFIKAKFYQAGGTTYLVDEQTLPILHSADGLKGVGLEDKDYQVGTETYTDKADDSVVHVEIDGKSSHSDDSVLTLDRLGNYGPYNTAPTYNANTDTITFTYLNTNSVSHIAVNNHASFKGDRRYIISGYAHINGSPLVWSSGRLNTQNPVSNSHSFYTDSQTGYFEVDETYTTSWLLHTAIRGVKSGDIITIRNFKAVPVDPHPDMPKKIHSLNDFDVVSDVGRNLISNTEGPFESIKTNSSSYQDFITRRTNVVPTDKEYILSFKAKASSPMTLRSHFYNPNTTTRTETSTGYVGHGVDGTADTEIGTEWDSYWIKWTQNKASGPKSVIVARILDRFNGINLEMKEVKLEKGNKATDWTPAPEDITEDSNHPLIDRIDLSLSEPLRSVGDVKDRLFRDDSDELWKIERNVGEMVLDGSRSWGTVWNVHNNHGAFILRSFASTINPSLEKYNFIKSDKFVGVSRNDLATIGSHINKEGIAQGNTYLALRINIDRLGSYDVEAFRNWLRNNPITVYYYLSDKSYIESLGQEIQDKLNNLRSFQDSNYVYTIINNKTDIISENLKPQIYTVFRGGGWYARWKSAYDLEKTTEYIEQEIKRTQNTAWVRAGMRIGYSSFTQTNPKSVYICGLEYRDGHRDMVLVDKPAEIYVRDSEQTDTIPNQALSASGIPTGTTAYIIWDNTKKELFFIYYESVMTSTGVSRKRWRNISGQTIEFTDSLFAIGEVET